MTITNAMRLLKQAGIPYEDLSGVHAAAELGADPAQVFKTLVTRGEKLGIQVFCIPVAAELDLKKCASLTGDKKIEMIAVKEMLSLTGYIRGGCSPVGMKKKYPTFIHESAAQLDKIYVSAGQRGLQLILSPEDLRAYLDARWLDIIK